MHEESGRTAGSESAALPRIISADDHVLEPPDLWWSRLPHDTRERGPHVRREKGVLAFTGSTNTWVHDPRAEGATWADVWYYDDMVWPLRRGPVASGYRDDDPARPITYEEVLPGTYQREARLADMDRNHTDVSVCFPNVSRFCGQMFLERTNRELALLGVRAYNDWMIEEWCGSDRPARLIPLTIIPLWDAQLAANEVRRCAEKGSHAVAFSENPTALGLPSIFSPHWDPFLQACEETDTVINMHVGSSSTMLTSADDAPPDMTLLFLFVNAQMAFADWLYSGVLQEFPSLRIVMSESQVGWMPFVSQRIDNTFTKFPASSRSYGRRAVDLPSSVVPGRVFGCIFDDLEGLRNRESVGVGQIMMETDYPHTDSTFPHSAKVIDDMVREAGLSDEEIYAVLRGNAIKVYGLDRYFGVTG